jgi:hypothetical protein
MRELRVSVSTARWFLTADLEHQLQATVATGGDRWRQVGVSALSSALTSALSSHMCLHVSLTHEALVELSEAHARRICKGSGISWWGKSVLDGNSV